MENIPESNLNRNPVITKKNKKKSTNKLMKAFIYLCLILFALSILIPLGWSILAAFKHKSEFYGNPWALPEGLYLENFKTAFIKSHMGEYFFNSLFVTALALVILLVISIPAAYVLSRFNFKSKKLLNTIFAAGLFINVNYIVVPIFLLILDADKASAPTNLEINIPSIIVYREKHIIMIIVGKVYFINDVNVILFCNVLFI